MGCDIHIHSEIKLKGAWHHYAQPHCSRNYALFGKMAGVRDVSVQPLGLPRGLPHDTTIVTDFDRRHWDSDGHSHSWLNATEILLLRKWWDKEFKGVEHTWPDWDQWLFGNNYSDFAAYPRDRIRGLEDVRFLFWFDN